MTMIKPPISRYNKEIKQFCEKHHIAKLSLFGSFLTTAFKKSSDVDFLVSFDKQHIPTLFAMIGMEMELSDLIGHKADLRTANELSPPIRETVLSKAKTIYERS
ncbi:MAG: nucleotidyltransferase domain-containing protein [Verrucomicrobia bacterium]|nr:nucleotidyltransferase domain-containing protein [Verrucomicrobiota bacterium]